MDQQKTEQQIMNEDLTNMVKFLNECYIIFNEQENFTKEQKEVSAYYQKGISEIRAFLLKLSGAVNDR